MAVAEIIRFGALAPSSPSPGAVTVRLDEDEGPLSTTLLDLLSNEAVASIVTRVGFDEQATLTIAIAQLRRQLREL